MLDNPSARISVSSLNHSTVENGTSNGTDKARGLGLTISTAPQQSPTTSYPGPKPPYSSTSVATPSTHSNIDYMSPPSSRRTTMDDKVPRQSLPSIQEALKGDNNLPYTSSTVPPPFAAPTRPEQASLPPARPLTEPILGPPNPFSQPTTAPPDRWPRSSNPQDSLVGQDNSRSSFASINATAPLPPSTFRSTPRSPRSATYPQYSPSYQPSPHSRDFGPPPGVSPNFRLHQSPYAPSYASAEAVPPPVAGPDSRYSPAVKTENGRPPFPSAHPPAAYSKAVKRHIDTYDVEYALNEIMDRSSQTGDFARRWSERVHQRQRNGYLPSGCLPGLVEIDDLMRQVQRMNENLEAIRSAVIAQQSALADEQAMAHKEEPRDAGVMGFSHELKPNGEFTMGDAKKRRGKAAPPGRCHSCNRAETPEWRRGPDGARTLCNACGLHYAKLSRKNAAANKNAPAAGSNLRPKDMGNTMPP